MPDWVSLIIKLWPIASTITPIILLAGFLWLRQKFPSKEDFDSLKRTVDALQIDQVATKNSLEATNSAIKELKADRDDPPTRVQLMAEMAVLAGRVSGIEAEVKGVGKQVETSNDYLQILIERGVSK
ncbi:hypothetical protein CG471_11865 [Sphingobium sp. IP1]|uniref:hypothetical protein n=1 Tax=Sphingobium sp. IP1 TaxID=2021637 RepID=UPI000C080773|nr:hypothetical protein [Sphingobium sp. IP1]PHP19549.1 hypothetical protein CG471_11865 [Sphingobium sp. IP1]